MSIDMKKCVQKAWKQHGIHLFNEQEIIDNLKYSEEWFTNTFQELQQIFSKNIQVKADKQKQEKEQSFLGVDFKEFTEILYCIKDNDQLFQFISFCERKVPSYQQAINQSRIESKIETIFDENEEFSKLSAKQLQFIKQNMLKRGKQQKVLLQNSQNEKDWQSLFQLISYNQQYMTASPNNFKSSQQFVCAAKSLHVSLMRCKWFIQIQNLLGVGKLSKALTKVPYLILNEDPVLQLQRSFQKPKNFIGLVQLNDILEILDLQDFIKKNGAQSQKIISNRITNQNDSAISQQQEILKDDILLVSGMILIFQNIIQSFQDIYLPQKSLNKRLEILKFFEAQDTQVGKSSQDYVINLKIISDLISKCENIYFLFGLKEGSSIDQLEIVVKSLQKLQFDIQQLLTQVQIFNVRIDLPQDSSNQRNLLSLSTKNQLQILLDESINLLKFSIQVNQQKIQSGPAQNYLLNLDQANYLLNQGKNELKVSCQQYFIDLQNQANKIQKFNTSYTSYSELKNQMSISNLDQKVRFSISFLKNLISEIQNLQIFVSDFQQVKERIEIIQNDLNQFQELRKKAIEFSAKMEQDLFQRKSVGQLSKFGKIIRDFQDLIKEFFGNAIYDKKLYKMILGYQWLLQCYELINSGKFDQNFLQNKQIIFSINDFFTQISILQKEDIDIEEDNLNMNLKQWLDFFNLQKYFSQVFVELKDYPIVQKLQNEISSGQTIIEQVQQMKDLQQKFLKIFSQCRKPGQKDNPEQQKKVNQFFEEDIKTKKLLENIDGENVLQLAEYFNQERLEIEFNKKIKLQKVNELLQKAKSIKINTNEEIRYLNNILSHHQKCLPFSEQIGFQQEIQIKQNFKCDAFSLEFYQNWSQVQQNLFQTSLSFFIAQFLPKNPINNYLFLVNIPFFFIQKLCLKHEKQSIDKFLNSIQPRKQMSILDFVLNKRLSYPDCNKFFKLKILSKADFFMLKMLKIIELQNSFKQETEFFPYEKYEAKQLKETLKKIFISPIKNWDIFQRLNKRILVAKKTIEQLKPVIHKILLIKNQRNIDNCFQSQLVSFQKVKLSQITPIIQYHHKSCQIYGLKELQIIQNLLNSEFIQIFVKAQEARSFLFKTQLKIQEGTSIEQIQDEVIFTSKKLNEFIDYQIIDLDENPLQKELNQISAYIELFQNIILQKDRILNEELFKKLVESDNLEIINSFELLKSIQEFAGEVFSLIAQEIDPDEEDNSSSSQSQIEERQEQSLYFNFGDLHLKFSKNSIFDQDQLQKFLPILANKIQDAETEEEESLQDETMENDEEGEISSVIKDQSIQNSESQKSSGKVSQLSVEYSRLLKANNLSVQIQTNDLKRQQVNKQDKLISKRRRTDSSSSSSIYESQSDRSQKNKFYKNFQKQYEKNQRLELARQQNPHDDSNNEEELEQLCTDLTTELRNTSMIKIKKQVESQLEKRQDEILKEAHAEIFAEEIEKICFNQSEQKVDDSYSRKISYVINNIKFLFQIQRVDTLKLIFVSLKRLKSLIVPWNGELPSELILQETKKKDTKKKEVVMKVEEKKEEVIHDRGRQLLMSMLEDNFKGPLICYNPMQVLIKIRNYH